MSASGVALSVKQPWAALLAAGVKTVEVRTWRTARRGTVFLHAAKVPDPRPHGWTFVAAPQLTRDAALGGGIVAVAELVDCVTYPDATAFAADAARHRNLPAWFKPPRLYGFVFADIRPLPFQAVTGNTFFFPVSGVTLPPPAGPVIIIDPPEGQDARHHDFPPAPRPPG